MYLIFFLGLNCHVPLEEVCEIHKQHCFSSHSNRFLLWLCAIHQLIDCIIDHDQLLDFEGCFFRSSCEQERSVGEISVLIHLRYGWPSPKPIGMIQFSIRFRSSVSDDHGKSDCGSNDERFVAILSSAKRDVQISLHSTESSLPMSTVQSATSSSWLDLSMILTRSRSD